MRLLLIIVGAFGAIGCIEPPALAQSNPSISVHQKKHRRTGIHQSDSRALAAPYRNPQGPSDLGW